MLKDKRDREDSDRFLETTDFCNRITNILFGVIAVTLVLAFFFPDEQTKKQWKVKDDQMFVRARELAYPGTWQVTGVDYNDMGVSVYLFHRKMGEGDHDIYRYETASFNDPSFQMWRKEKAGDFIVTRTIRPTDRISVSPLGYVEPVSLIHGNQQGSVLGL